MSEMPWIKHAGRFTRFGSVGGLCALLNFVILYVGTTLLHAHYLVSAMISFLILTPLSFLLHKAFSFRDNNPLTIGQLNRYLLNLVLAVIANITLMTILVEVGSLNYLVSALFATILVFIGSYAANFLWVFRARH